MSNLVINVLFVVEYLYWNYLYPQYPFKLKLQPVFSLFFCSFSFSMWVCVNVCDIQTDDRWIVHSGSLAGVLETSTPYWCKYLIYQPPVLTIFSGSLASYCDTSLWEFKNLFQFSTHDSIEFGNSSTSWVVQVISKTVWPIAENLLQADYVIDGSGARRSFV